MLDIKYIRANAEKIKEAAKNKNIDIDIDKLIELDEERRGALLELENARSRRNELAQIGKKEKPSAENIEKGKKLKNEITDLESELKNIENEYLELMARVPAIPSPDTPVGKDETANVVVQAWGEPTKFDFVPKSHIELGQELDLFDSERGVKVAGYRGYYVKNEAVFMQMGLLIMALNKLVSRGFKAIIPPTLVKEFALFGSGYFSGLKYNPQKDEIYKIANQEIEADGRPSKEDKFLVGTAEPSLLSYHADEILDEKDLPIKLAGFSQCYRSEIGSYGKDTRGLYRVHEFMKVEQVIICKADLIEAENLHQEMVAISRELHEDLGLPYRQIQICTGDMGPGKYKMYDLEAWLPSRGSYGETGSASNFLDWQSRRLNVRYRDSSGQKKFAYMLNNTALASIRPLIAILENFQQADGSLKVPTVLRKYLPGEPEQIRPKK